MFLKVCVGVIGVQEKEEPSRANKERNGPNQTERERMKEREKKCLKVTPPLVCGTTVVVLVITT